MFPFLLCLSPEERATVRADCGKVLPFKFCPMDDTNPEHWVLFFQGVCESPVPFHVCLGGDFPLDLCFRVCLLFLPMQI